MKKGDYTHLVGKRVRCVVSTFACANKTGLVLEADEYGGLFILWDNPNKSFGEKGFLFANEVAEVTE